MTKEKKEGPELKIIYSCDNCKYLDKIFDAEDFPSGEDPIYFCSKLKRVLHENKNTIRSHPRCPFSEKVFMDMISAVK